MTLDIHLDVDGANQPVGVELLGMTGADPVQRLRVMANGYVPELLSDPGYEIPRLRGKPEVAVWHLG